MKLVSVISELQANPKDTEDFDQVRIGEIWTDGKTVQYSPETPLMRKLATVPIQGPSYEKITISSPVAFVENLCMNYRSYISASPAERVD